MRFAVRPDEIIRAYAFYRRADCVDETAFIAFTLNEEFRKQGNAEPVNGCLGHGSELVKQHAGQRRW